jgi:hypothetical protein
MNDLRQILLLGLGATCMVLLAVGMTACGDSGSSTADQSQLEAARKEGEEAAREKERVSRLERQVNNLKKRSHREEHASPTGSSAIADESAGGPQRSESSVLRSFHAPSGNVSCEIRSNGALCSVNSIGETFTFSDRGAARVEPGAALPRSYGELAPYGTVVSAASITCTIPQSNEPKGVTCTDSESGHGFEASRVPARQKAY